MPDAEQMMASTGVPYSERYVNISGSIPRSAIPRSWKASLQGKNQGNQRARRNVKGGPV